MEAEESREAEGEDKEMKDAEAATKMVLRFRKLPYTTETGEAEMIAMQFVREGGASATVESGEKQILEQFDKKVAVDDGKGKRRAVAYEESSQSKKDASAASTEQAAPGPDANLTRAEAEYMAALQAKYNAIKMMKSRLALVIAYLQRLPPDFTSGNQTTSEAADFARASNGAHTIPSNTILRHIQALVTNADLVAPAEQATLEREIQRETNDVNLISIISDLMSSVNEVREVGKKFHVVEMSRNSRLTRLGGASGPQFDSSALLAEIGAGPLNFAAAGGAAADL
jgi:COP9 signalosome complex subunit 6